MNDSPFRLDFDVRDYECDLTGIVNNANYQHYLEHTRHVFLKKRRVDFAEWYQRGISLVVVRIEMDFIYPLRSGDHFYVSLTPERVSRLRIGFNQDIFRIPDDKLVLKSQVTASAINTRGRPEVPPELMALIFGE